jgi:CRISPR-associated endonuclease/helicase Cas3
VLEWKPETETNSALPVWLDELFVAMRSFHGNDIAHHPGGGIVLRAKRQNSNYDETDYFSDEDDAPSEAPDEVPLQTHCAKVAAVAERLAHTCLGENAASVLRAAGDWHDAGKLDPRFQEMLRNGAPADGTEPPLAKSPRKPRSRERAQEIGEATKLPGNFRHEMLSMQLTEQLCKAELSPEDQELLLHLIASHHGHAHPFAPVCEDDVLPAVKGKLDCGSLAISGAERQALTAPHRLDSGITHRFWTLVRRHGWWGLAHREAILRLADWYASEHPDSENRPRL